MLVRVKNFASRDVFFVILNLLASAALRLGPPGLLTKTTKVHILKLDTSTKIDTAIPYKGLT